MWTGSDARAERKWHGLADSHLTGDGAQPGTGLTWCGGGWQGTEAGRCSCSAGTQGPSLTLAGAETRKQSEKWDRGLRANCDQLWLAQENPFFILLPFEIEIKSSRGLDRTSFSRSDSQQLWASLRMWQAAAVGAVTCGSRCDPAPSFPSAQRQGEVERTTHILDDWALEAQPLESVGLSGF